MRTWVQAYSHGGHISEHFDHLGIVAFVRPTPVFHWRTAREGFADRTHRSVGAHPRTTRARARARARTARSGNGFGRIRVFRCARPSRNARGKRERRRDLGVARPKPEAYTLPMCLHEGAL